MRQLTNNNNSNRSANLVADSYLDQVNSSE